MNLRFVVFTLLLVPSLTTAQVALQSEHLRNPDLLIDNVDTNASFWLSVYDATNGGFYTNVSRNGNVNVNWGTNKDVLTQSRDAYAMVRAFQLTGNESYLDYARGALDFMFEHGWDGGNGGWLNKLSSLGIPLEPNSNKTAFIHHYALLGLTALVEATDDSTAWRRLLLGYDFNETNLWDSRPDYLGYHDQTNRTASAPSGKSFNATVDAITTHALQLYLLTGDQKYLEKLQQLADNIIDRLVATMPDQAIGFAEKYDSDWNVNPSERLSIMGHVLKTAWCLARINEIGPNPDYVIVAEDLVAEVLTNAYDHDFGGPYKDYDRVSGEMMLWGIPDTTKAWWQMEQAVVAGLELYRTTQKEEYLEMADETLDFFMSFFQDPDYGEVYADRTRYGGGIPQWGDHKGDGYKAAYHSVELGYYAYLYGKLFLQEQPATLHYFFDAHPDERSVRLNPMATSGDIIIADVRLDQVAYADYISDSRVLNVPAGVTGHFEVDYTTASAVSVESLASRTFVLEQNYPNPFSDVTTIPMSLDQPEYVKLEVFDVMGRRVRTLIDGDRRPGVHSVTVDMEELAVGTYFYRLVTASGTQTQVMAVVR